jgi:hypothetical protein
LNRELSPRVISHFAATLLRVRAPWTLTALVLLGCPPPGSPVDAGAPVCEGLDAGGRWVACCKGGEHGTCFCAEGAPCSYGNYFALPDAGCFQGDGGSIYADDAGLWFTCCGSSAVTVGRLYSVASCVCAKGAVCDNGLGLEVTFCAQDRCRYSRPP